ncbi:MAG: DUF3168 domain-containing protein [Pseudomonadota bacterium]
MSYAGAGALQEAAYQALSASPALEALVGGRVFDAAPHRDGPEGAPGTYVLLGDERTRPWGARGLEGAEHELEVAVVSPAESFASAKAAAGAVSDVLLGPLPALAAGRVATAQFAGARTRRLRDGGRRIELRFRFRVEL